MNFINNSGFEKLSFKSILAKISWGYLAIVGLAVLARLVPHPANFTPIVGIALFSGFKVGRRIESLAVPVLAMLLSDLVIGLHDQMIPVYIALALIVGLGAGLAPMTERLSKLSYAGVVLSSSLIFFVVTNFGVWLSTPFYAKTIAGLAECFVLAIPFFERSLVGDIFYCGLFFALGKVLANSQTAVPQISNSQLGSKNGR